MDGLKIYIQPPQAGYHEVARRIRRQLIPIQDFKIVFAVLGRPDMECQQAELPLALDNFLSAVLRFNPGALVIFAAPIPKGLDSRKLIGRCHNAGKVVHAFASQQERADYSRVAEQFYNKKGINCITMLPTGATALGRASLRSVVRSKLQQWLG